MRAFVLCLRGTRMGPDAYYFKNHYALRDELGAAQQAAKQQFPRIAAEAAVYAGFSQGSSMGTLFLGEQGKEFPYLILVEGFELWNRAAAASFLQSGGRSVLLVCGTNACSTKAERSRTALQRTGVTVEVAVAPGAGHTLLGEIRPLVLRGLSDIGNQEALWR
jgi:predicted esterase